MNKPEKEIISPPKAGPETKALKRFYPEGKATWTGTVKAGGMGPGSPEITAKGRGTCKWIMDGLWVVCDFEQDQLIADKKVIGWKAHWVTGWDFVAQEYRAVVVDSNGNSGLFRGKIEGINEIERIEAVLKVSLPDSRAVLTKKKCNVYFC